MGAKLGKGLLTALIVLSLLLSVVPVLAADMAETSDLEASEMQAEEVCQVTLITGDVVTVATNSGGQRSFAISPAEPDRLGQHFLTIKEHDNTYIIPDEVDLEKLDRELFNIDYLVNEEYYQEPSLPLLVSYAPSLAKSRVQSLEDKISSLGQETNLHEEINTISTRLTYKNIAASYNSLMSQPEVEKVWLDKKIHAQLMDSVPLIGAEWWWDSGYRGEGEEIAILDTGIDSSHPALDDLDDDPSTNDPKVIVNVNFSDDQGFDDLYGHGTHCAGIAAGTATGTDYQGVAPGAQLWNVKVLNQWGSGWESWIVSGINFASLGPDGVPQTGDEADIISMSLGLLDYSDGSDPLSQAVNLAVEWGVVVAVAAGNDGYRGPFTIGTPGVAEKVITVGASDKEDNLAHLSSLGPTVDFRIKPDILAPGVDITSSVPGAYEAYSGTSMATPHVAGAAALLRQYYGDTVSPQLIKDALMYTAEDLGYTVYEQGSGRLDLAWEPWPIVGITPATLSLGVFTSEEATYGTLTFFTDDNMPHHVTLTAELSDVISGVHHLGIVSFTPTSFYIPAGGEVNVELSIDLSTLPASLYSGKVRATVDGGVSKTIHAIFGFSKLREVTVHKIDINGEPAQGHLVWVLMDSPLQCMWQEWQETDESGNFTFYAPDGNYHIVSPNWGYEENQVTIWTIAENVAISGDMTIKLDERDTVLVDFDPNKLGQVVAGQSSGLYFGYWHAWTSWCRYPSSFLTRVSPISRFDASFTYSYYPEADFIPDNPWLVNTGEWHNLRYSVTKITGDTTFVADYDNLAHRRTGYCVALNGEKAEWAQHSFDNIAWVSMGFIYAMDAPQEHWEWLSPEPVRYGQWYAKAEPWGEWYFRSSYMSYAPGEYRWRIGCHPLTSGVDIGIWGHELDIWGPISRDSANNDFCNQQAWFSGHIKVTQDGEVVLDDDIWDYFYRWVSFEGTPQVTVEVCGETPLELSRHSYTRLDFTADPSHDYRPPRLLFRVPGMDLFGVVPGGEVKVKVQVADDSLVDSVHLDYSLDDGDTWNDTGLPVFEGGWFIFNLGQLQGTFVSIAVDAQDEYGNRIHRYTNRAFRVGGAGVPPTVSIDPQSQTVPAGKSSSVDVAVDSSTYNLKACHVEVSYDPAIFTDVTVEENGLLGTNILTEPFSGVTDGLVKYGVTRLSGNEPVPVSGAFVTISFTVSDTAATGSYALNVHSSVLKDETGVTIPGVVENDGTLYITVRKGDFDGDSDVNFDDFVAFGDCYGSELGDANYNAIGDFDDSGVIDFDDFVAFGDVYGTSW